MNDIYSMIELLGAVPGYFFALLIGLRRKNHPANIILSFALFAYATQLLILFLFRRSSVEFYSLGLIGMNAFAMVAWPLFYRYISLISAPADALNKKFIIHGLLFLLYISGCLIPALLFPASFKLFFVLSMIMTGIVTASYNIAMLLSLLRYRKNIENFFSETEQLKATWIQITVIIWFAIIIEQILIFFIQSLGVKLPLIISELHGFFINIITTSWVYVIGYFAATHPDIFKQTEKMQEAILEEEKHKTDELPFEIMLDYGN